MSTSNGPTEPKSNLPTFTSIHDQPARQFSQTESSNASSGRSATRSGTRSNHNHDTRQSPSLGAREEANREDNDITRANGTVKRLKRSSAGFLINSSPASSRLSRSLLSHKSIKGKGKSVEGPLPVTKIRDQLDGPGSSPPVRDSLIASDIRSSPSDQAREGESTRSSRNTIDTPNQNGSVHSHRSSERAQNLPSFGFDTDPAQIVDMALRLSEGRKLQASGKRLVSASTPGRRVVSSATSPPSKQSPQNRPGHRASLNPVSRRKIPDLEPVTPQQTQRDLAVHAIEKSPIVQDGFSPEQDVEEADKVMQISRATQNRVAKAKAYFELAYEHRRLLSHLPPIRPPNAHSQSNGPDVDSKIYNPLQYARNRKLRFRERHPINSEAEGWFDVEKVRTWVDAVVSSHPRTHHDPVQVIRLPPLTLLEKDAKEPDDEDDDEETDTRTRNPQTKVRRPKSDWVTHPGDLIADAFWTEQGLNKKKIYNRDNEPIYPAGTKFSFSGWRDRGLLNVPEELKSSSPEFSPLQRKKIIDSPPDLPAFESARKEHSWAIKSKLGTTMKKDKKPKKTNKNRDIFDTSGESSQSDVSMDDMNNQRGRRRLAKGRDKFALSDGDPFTKPIQSADRTDSARRSSEIDPQKQSHSRDSMDRTSLLRYLQRSNTSTTVFTEDGEKTKLSKRRRLLETIRLDTDHGARSSFEYDSTAPGTPTGFGFPSIAIDLSPPHSRSPSPARKDSTGILGVVKDKALSAMNSREQKDHKNHIDRTDFAQPVSHNSSRSRSSISPHENISRAASPMTRGISPGNRHHKRSVDETAIHPIEHRQSNLSKASSQATDHSHRHHRVRGMFKGGRIAELVNHEVTRVGDFIWKREPPKNSVLGSGSFSGYETESDEFSDYDLEKSTKKPRRKVSRSSLTNSPTSIRSLSPTGRSSKFPSTSSAPALVPDSAQPQYHVQGLPNFTSPFQRDRQAHDMKSRAESPGGTPKQDGNRNSADPITSGNAVSRASRSPRFDRLAPPKLDIRSATPDGRRSSYGFGLSLDLTRTVSASQDYNSAINGAGYKPRERESTRLSSLAIPVPFFNDSDAHSQNDLSLTRTRSSANPKHVTIHDFARLRGLLASVAVKATNIATYCEETPDPQSTFLYSAFETTKASPSEIKRLLPSPRKRERALAARHLITHLATQSSDFNDRLSHFTTSTTVALQREIQVLEDNAESSLFPRLQKLSENAGQLAQQLTTTSTLAIRSVNDEVSEAARIKRRGPFRVSRWFWYKVIEYGVIGLLWGVWSIVMVIRVGLWFGRKLWALIAWLLWLR